MPLERLPDPPDFIIYKSEEEKICISSEHNPPQFMVYQPGRYRYTCPKCGKMQEFTIYPMGSRI
jgi:hypothetical protein